MDISIYIYKHLKACPVRKSRNFDPKLLSPKAVLCGPEVHQGPAAGGRKEDPGICNDKYSNKSDVEGPKICAHTMY